MSVGPTDANCSIRSLARALKRTIAVVITSVGLTNYAFFIIQKMMIL